jgi:CheY-like chemotaxis protein
MIMHSHPIILLVEDNPADLRLAQEVLSEASLADGILVARDGEQAMRMLRREGEHANLPEPDIVLLDLNLPRKHGREVLKEIKEDPRLRRMPVLILTTSRAESDVNACYDAHANAFLAKPVAIDDFARLTQVIREFWFGSVQLPAKGAMQ